MEVCWKIEAPSSPWVQTAELAELRAGVFRPAGARYRWQVFRPFRETIVFGGDPEPGGGDAGGGGRAACRSAAERRPELGR